MRVGLKLSLARLLCATGIDRALLSWQKSRLGHRFIRAVNYHDTPSSSAANLRRQLQFYREHWRGVSRDDLEGFLERGHWPHDKPGLIISFDDGLRSNVEVALPLLEEFDFTGWFFVPTDFLDTPPPQQAAFAHAHDIDHGPVPPDDVRIAMTWDEARALANRHVIGCHTRSHRRLSASLSPQQLDDEIVGAKAILEERLALPIEVFCWVGGEDWSYSAAAAERIRNTGYRFSFMTCSEPVTAATHPLQLHRTHVESDWPLELVRLQLCGVADAANAGKRARVNRLTAG